MQRDDAAVLYAVGQYVCSLVLRAIRQAPATAATYAHVANLMLQIAAADGKPVQYRTFIRNRFSVREVVVSPTPLTEDLAAGLELAPAVQDARGRCRIAAAAAAPCSTPSTWGSMKRWSANWQSSARCSSRDRRPPGRGDAEAQPGGGNILRVV